MEMALATGLHGRQAYTIKEISGILGLAENSVRKAIRQGIIPSRKINGRILIPIQAFDAWFNASTENN